MAAGIPSSSIVVGGFSQGGAMALMSLRSKVRDHEPALKGARVRNHEPALKGVRGTGTQGGALRGVHCGGGTLVAPGSCRPDSPVRCCEAAASSATQAVSSGEARCRAAWCGSTGSAGVSLAHSHCMASEWLVCVNQPPCRPAAQAGGHHRPQQLPAAAGREADCRGCVCATHGSCVWVEADCVECVLCRDGLVLGMKPVCRACVCRGRGRAYLAR